MPVSFSPSVNIIRDFQKELKYLPTANAERSVLQISDSFKKGIHAFTLIGSYGTGKSSFLWALQQDLSGKKKYFKHSLLSPGAPVRFLSLIGAYQSLIEHFSEQLDVKNTLKGNQRILDALYQEYEKVRSKNGLLVIMIDEFGKFLEHAAQSNPDGEIYFIQQLAEFVNDSDRRILLITTLHQNFEAYSSKNLAESQRQEWRKVKGRLEEITFNEPVEQLLVLAAKRLGINRRSNAKVAEIAKLEKKHHTLSIAPQLIDELGDSLNPLDFISASILTKAIQRYGQNERSLFTFLEVENLSKKEKMGLPEVYDYLFNEYHSYITTRDNVDYTAWAVIRDSIERCESYLDDSDCAVKILKTIGLLRIFGSAAGRTDGAFLKAYFNAVDYRGDVSRSISNLEKHKLILFAKYNSSYKIFEGSDINIEEELLHASREISEEIDICQKLKDHFEFPYISAKSVSYTKGTPRFFAFDIRDNLKHEIPSAEIDGYITLVLNPTISIEKVKAYSKECHDAVLFGYFNNSHQIRDTLYEIEKTYIVIARNSKDAVAKRELQNILTAQQQLLNHYVWGVLYSDAVTWIYDGKLIKAINSGADLNAKLSEIVDEVYYETPIFRNELINRHSISGAIHNARKNYFAALVKNNDQKDFGFPKKNFPPEKTIYISLLRETGIHVKDQGNIWDLKEPKRSVFKSLWNASEDFLESCKSEKKPLTSFFEVLGQKPFKMKQGFLEFWIPTFLFIKRDDFALFGDQGYIPELNESVLYLFNRNTKEFHIKTFDVKGIKLNLFNRYRQFLQLGKARISNQSFIESIKPFLVLYRQLPEYAKNTLRLNPESIAIRNAIAGSQDPEKVFFEDFPKALKTSIKNLAGSPKALERYTASLQTAIRELRTCLDELANRIEEFLVEQILGNNKLKFSQYKDLLVYRYSGLQEHQLLTKQRTLLVRIKSPLDDRKSWINSIAQAVMHKTLDNFQDEDEDMFKDRLLFLIQEMDNLAEINENVADHEDVIKLDLTTHEGLTKQIIHLPKSKNGEVKRKALEIRKLLGKDKRINLAIIAALLKEQIK